MKKTRVGLFHSHKLHHNFQILLLLNKIETLVDLLVLVFGWSCDRKWSNSVSRIPNSQKFKKLDVLKRQRPKQIVFKNTMKEIYEPFPKRNVNSLPKVSSILSGVFECWTHSQCVARMSLLVSDKTFLSFVLS